MATTAIQLEYPYHFSAVLSRDADAVAPRLATPVFRGAFDWHSAVHGHWTLARALRLCPDAPWAARVRTLLAMQLTDAKLAAEEAFLRAPGREGFERPYGLAWLLQLVAEFRTQGDEASAHWRNALAPLESIASTRLLAWLEKLPWPVRSGEHSQSAFALGLFFDWARDAGKPDLCARIAERVVRLYGADRDAPVRYEPSAHDFLSPLLAEADLLRRAMPREEFGEWLARFLPAPADADLGRWLTPARTPDRADGKFAHLDGLNLSRAWMLQGVVSALDATHAHAAVLHDAAARHRDAGLEGARSTHYAGSHWLGTFATYLVTERGLS
ncbi:MAG: DUF2891 domain-containing protein [Candidatus Eisenbacteria bacterium]|uniref:DUF2891 domain-containing protein n=1 Tax=Eiseniibacteriota bacterium TaxID=2212470 RepID=A0A933SCG8_UNCEI|nr:DUF2891 domain-containing protein [Candidatus Eisenbacteria bacterium]